MNSGIKKLRSRHPLDHQNQKWRRHRSVGRVLVMVPRVDSSNLGAYFNSKCLILDVSFLYCFVTCCGRIHITMFDVLTHGNKNPGLQLYLCFNS